MIGKVAQPSLQPRSDRAAVGCGEAIAFINSDAIACCCSQDSRRVVQLLLGVERRSLPQVTGAASRVWAANPLLNYRQVIEILSRTATDFNTPGWHATTGFGLLNLVAAVDLARATVPEEVPQLSQQESANFTPQLEQAVSDAQAGQRPTAAEASSSYSYSSSGDSNAGSWYETSSSSSSANSSSSDNGYSYTN